MKQRRCSYRCAAHVIAVASAPVDDNKRNERLSSGKAGMPYLCVLSVYRDKSAFRPIYICTLIYGSRPSKLCPSDTCFVSACFLSLYPYCFYHPGSRTHRYTRPFGHSPLLSFQKVFVSIMAIILLSALSCPPSLHHLIIGVDQT